VSHSSIVYRRDLLTHPFYRRWITGALSLDELRDYACQYAHVVAAIPSWLRTAASQLPQARARLERHAREEDGHVGLWRQFAEALGLTEADLAGATPRYETVLLLKRGTQLTNQSSGIGAVWALEVQAPAVSAQKLEALRAHYGIHSATAVAYFQLHSTRDRMHTAELDRLIVQFDAVTFYASQRTADLITDGLWDLLSSVNRPEPHAA